MFGPIDDLLGNAGLATALTIPAPAFGEEEFGVEHGAETGVKGAERELDGDNAVGGFAEPAAILPLHARRFLAGLGMTGVVNDADGLGVVMITGDDLLKAIAGACLIPDIAVEILLERARRNVVEERDRLDALALQIAELPTHVMLEMLPRLGSAEAGVELAEKFDQGRFERQDLIERHP